MIGGLIKYLMAIIIVIPRTKIFTTLINWNTSVKNEDYELAAQLRDELNKKND